MKSIFKSKSAEEAKNFCLTQDACKNCRFNEKICKKMAKQAESSKEFFSLIFQKIRKEKLRKLLSQ